MSQFLPQGIGEVARGGGAGRQGVQWNQAELATAHAQHRVMEPGWVSDMRNEEAKGVVATDYSVTSMMHDDLNSSAMRVKSGYAGHVPMGRNFVGGSYRTLNNRGLPGTIEAGAATRIAVAAQPDKSLPQSGGLVASDPALMQQAHAGKAKAPKRVERVLSNDQTDYDSFRATPWGGDWLMTGYTGHAPKAKEVIGTSPCGPPEGPAYHGPMEVGKYSPPRIFPHRQNEDT